MTQKELHNVVLVATRYNETRSAIDNAIRVLNNLQYIGYYGYDNTNIKNLAYQLQKELEKASDKFTQNEVIQYFKDNEMNEIILEEGNYYRINGTKRILYWNGNVWMSPVKDNQKKNTTWVSRLDKQPKIKSVELVENFYS